ncbi:MAG: rod shape-determining protein MreC [Acidobacteriota bacterium]|nr:rod shape-determining protein MreC [Acidobacteriota bacterium]
MESILNRYRNLTVLLVVIVAQLLLIAYQVKTNKDVPLIRVWAVTAVTPIEQVLEVVRRNTWVFVEDYFVLLHTRTENEKLRNEIGRIKLENHYLKSQLSTADRARALSVFQAQAPSKTVAARIIGNGTGANSKIVFVDRGSGAGVEAGMAVVTPDGIIGKVVRAYPTASLIQLMTDGNFAAGVVSQKNHVRGTMKGQGHDGTVMVDYVQNEERVEVGEWFYTSGDDRVFPKGFPVGQTAAVRNGRLVKEIYVTPSGFQNGLEEVLIVLDGVHHEIPDMQVASPGYKMLAPPQANPADSGLSTQSSGPNTDADRLKEQYRQLGAEEKHTYGEGGFDKPPDFTKLPPLRGEPKKEAVAAGKTVPPAAPANATPGAAPSAGALLGQTPSVLAKPKSDSAGQTTAATPPVVKPKPRTGPLLVTDPTDADPSEPQPKAPPAPNRP